MSTGSAFERSLFIAGATVEQVEAATLEIVPDGFTVDSISYVPGFPVKVTFWDDYDESVLLRELRHRLPRVEPEEILVTLDALVGQ